MKLMFWTLKQIKRFLNQTFSDNMILTINRLTRNTATSIYHFIANKREYGWKVYWRHYDEKSTNLFKQKLHETTLDNIRNIKEHNEEYRKIIKTFSFIYESIFPKKRVRVKFKNLINPWETKGITKSSKKKQRLYQKYLKKRTSKNEKIYKSYKSLPESIKQKSKNFCYSEKLLKLQENAKETWRDMKEIIGKAKLLHVSHLPQKNHYKQNKLIW